MNQKTAVVYVTFGLVLLAGLAVHDYARFFDNKLHVVFCNVGQGDAIFIRTPSRKNILIDGGPDKEIFSCLGHYMPFWDRQLHMVYLTHPHDDHYSGIYYVMESYITLYFVTENLANSTKGYTELLAQVRSLHIPLQYAYAGDTFRLADGVAVKVLGPDSHYLEKTSPNGLINSGEFASLLLQVSYGDFDVLFTGDSQKEGIQNAKKYIIQDIDLLQVPHHGSKTGLDTNTIQLLAPKHAVISVGKNRYGHPSKDIIRLLEEHEISISRTDKEGSVEFVSDGQHWWKVGK